eukprot:Gregarina_sp_Poly_1__4260@NODE_2320_length_2299_cov_744_976703_g1485_i0_p2_GENE_NODE_2320_length_2299_cov_744_976703_g1485_i0NODE_2320_length_2299_cov_744_976703_g1485_i0_p2_ORF_typecomplete_len203_score25_98DUF2686/PF10887_8/0_3_NODE_2320_length_2299_cov_744_976703_g1485_i010131621
MRRSQAVSVLGQVVSLTGSEMESHCSYRSDTKLNIAHQGIVDYDRQPDIGTPRITDFVDFLAERLQLQRQQELQTQLGSYPAMCPMISPAMHPALLSQPARSSEETEPPPPYGNKVHEAVQFANDLQAVLAMNSPFGGADTFAINGMTLFAGFGLIVTLTVAGGMIIYALNRRRAPARTIRLSVGSRSSYSSSSTSRSSWSR